jgi:hypothetical protein
VFAAAPAVHIAGSRFVDKHGQAIRLLGVNGGPGLSFACVEPIYDAYRQGGVWGGPVDDAAIAAMTSWKINAVRISLNEDCWLGINPVRRTAGRIREVRHGAHAAGRRIARHYRAEVRGYVRRLHAHGLIAIVDLHWTAPGRTLAFEQWPLPDRDHAPALWRSVARAFRTDASVVFEVFNEPYLSNPETLSWSCLRGGCRLPNRCADCHAPRAVPPGCQSCPTAEHPGGSYRAAGMQALVNAIRSTRARQPILSPGRWYSNDLSDWLRYRPHDPLGQLGASFHAYEGLPCDKIACWQSEIAPIAAQVPVVTTEFGPNNTNADGSFKQEPCDEGYDNDFMGWADQRGVSYLAWAWYYDNSAVDNAQRPNCTLNLLDQDWYGATPRPGHGQAVHDHLAALSTAQGGGPVR